MQTFVGRVLLDGTFRACSMMPIEFETTFSYSQVARTEYQRIALQHLAKNCNGEVAAPHLDPVSRQNIR